MSTATPLKQELLKQSNLSSTSTLDSNIDEESDEQNSAQIFQLPAGEGVAKAVLRKLMTAAFIAFIFLLIEVVGGILSGSLAILSDVAHMFSDLSGFFISILSVQIGRRPASRGLSFGYHRSEVIGAMCTIAVVWCLSLFLVFQATERVINKEAVKEPLYMLITSCFGLATNCFIAKILHSTPQTLNTEQGHNHTEHKHSHNEKCNHSHSSLNKAGSFPKPVHFASLQNSEHKQNSQNFEELSIKPQKGKNLSSIEPKDNYNLKAAMIHVIGDIIQSAGIVVASFTIYLFGGDEEYTNWHLADPICTYFFSLIVFLTTLPVCRECIRVLMEGSPYELDLNEFERQLKSVENVVEIHDLHVWSLSKGKPAMMCHIFVNGEMRRVLREATIVCRKNGIYHSTIQIEEWDQKDQKDYIKCIQNIHK